MQQKVLSPEIFDGLIHMAVKAPVRWGKVKLSHDISG